MFLIFDLNRDKYLNTAIDSSGMSIFLSTRDTADEFPTREAAQSMIDAIHRHNYTNHLVVFETRDSRDS